MSEKMEKTEEIITTAAEETGEIAEKDLSMIENPGEYWKAMTELSRRTSETLGLSLFGESPEGGAFSSDDEPVIAGTIDVARFLKAQGAYIRAQTNFINRRTVVASPDYIQHLTRYSLAQGEFIEACTEILEQLRVL